MKAPSALPGISPTGGEIGWAAPLGSIVIVWGEAPYGSISHLVGEMSGRTEGGAPRGTHQLQTTNHRRLTCPDTPCLRTCERIFCKAQENALNTIEIIKASIYETVWLAARSLPERPAEPPPARRNRRLTRETTRRQQEKEVLQWLVFPIVPRRHTRPRLPRRPIINLR
jgi:hypothetical protein